MPENLLGGAHGPKWNVVAYIGDALRVNDAVCAKLNKQVHYKCISHGDSGDPTAQCQTLFIQMHCMIHQISLTRKHLALAFSGLWSNLVRLGHLFESHSFRLHFKRCMRQVISNNFHYISVDSLPSDAVSWRDARIKGLRLFSDSSHGGLSNSSGASKRLKALVNCTKDNGNPSGDAFCHWCVPGCCAKGKSEALEEMLNQYEAIFDRMPIPLLYRWKHAGQAIAFMRDGIVLHNILSRTLNEMSSGARKSHPVQFVFLVLVHLLTGASDMCDMLSVLCV